MPKKSKKKSSREYWRDRAIDYEKESEKRGKVFEQRLARHYRQSLTAIKEDILKLYGTFAKDNGMDFDESRRFLGSRELREWRISMQEYLRGIADGDAGLQRELNTLAMRSRITRLEKLYSETLQELDGMGRRVGKSVRDFLSDSYTDSYARNIFDFVKVGGLSVALAKLDNIAVEKVIASRWSGKNFSQRIWTNTKLLSGALREAIADGIHRGLSVQQMSKLVDDKMKSGYGNAVRLVRTEMNFVNNQAHADSMKDAEIDSYEFIAVLDNRTSAKCRARDGEVYPLEEKSVGFNYPPLHPRCRSTVAPYIEGVSRSGKRAAKDKNGKYIEIPESMKYNDYKAVYIDKTQTFEQWRDKNETIGFKAVDEKDKINLKYIQRETNGSENNYISIPLVTDFARKVIKTDNPTQLNELLKKFVTDEYIKIDYALKVPLSYNVEAEKIFYTPKHPHLSSYDLIESITHEIVHLIDLEYGVSISLSNEIFVKTEKAKNIIFKNKEYYKKLLNEKCGENMNISDLVAAITDSEIYGFFAHDKEYWSVMGNKEREIVANLMTAYYTNDKETLDFIEHIKPLKDLLEEVKKHYGMLQA